MDDNNNTLRVGYVVATHGIKGELRVFPTTDDPERFLTLKECIIETREGRHILHPCSVRFFKKFVIMGFTEYNNINDVIKFCKKDILVSRENAVKLEPGEHFICDLVGNKVIADTGEELGILTDVITSAANNVYIVENSEGREILIPVIPDCNIVHNVEEKTTTVHLLDGLTDL